MSCPCLRLLGLSAFSFSTAIGSPKGNPLAHALARLRIRLAAPDPGRRFLPDDGRRQPPHQP